MLMILAVLAAGPQHGYLLMREIERLSSGWVRLSTGTMYGRRRLEAEQTRLEQLAQLARAHLRHRQV